MWQYSENGKLGCTKSFEEIVVACKVFVKTLSNGSKLAHTTHKFSENCSWNFPKFFVKGSNIALEKW